jgi:hypothetical protein
MSLLQIDGVDRTVNLSDVKAQAIGTKILVVLWKTHVSLKRFRSLLGRLQHAACILPSAKGLFSPLNKATKNCLKTIGLGKDTSFCHWASRPTHVSELIEHEPDLAAGRCDASSEGAGSLWIGLGIQPAVWHLEWPADVVELNKQGALADSDLEMASTNNARFQSWGAHGSIRSFLRQQLS